MFSPVSSNEIEVLEFKSVRDCYLCQICLNGVSQFKSYGRGGADREIYVDMSAVYSLPFFQLLL